MNVHSPDELVATIQGLVGDAYEVTADMELLAAEEDERRGGRCDDRRRAADIEAALGDDAVRALVALRGGAWFTRILPLIDFTVLDRRTEPIWAVGFSELTTLVNLVGAHERGRGFYSITPGFLTYGLRRHAATRLNEAQRKDLSPANWMRSRLRHEVATWFSSLAAVLGGERCVGSIPARLAGGELPAETQGVFVGGNLTVFSTLVGSRYEATVRPAGRWLLLEDFNDKLERFDRFLAHLTLAGYWDDCAGILLGDFHQDERALTGAVMELLRYHLPPGRAIPLLITDRVGHIWPAEPLLLHRPVLIRCSRDGHAELIWDAMSLMPDGTTPA
jgi:muramoyltetrapeptide carboxypeptidase